MKLTEDNIKREFDHALMYLTNGIDERLKKMEKEFREKMFGLHFFLNVEFGNFLMDMIYFRDCLETHIVLCRKNGVDEKAYAIDMAQSYLKKLVDIEMYGVIHSLKLIEPWYPYSKETKKKLNKQMCDLLEEIIAEEGWDKK